MSASGWLLVIGALGVLVCFTGYRLFRLAVTLLGASVGAVLGHMAGTTAGVPWGAWAGAIVGALVLGVLALLVFRVSVALFGGAVFALTAAALLSPGGWIPQIVGAAAAGLAGAVVALILQRPVVVFSTAAAGALVATLAGVLAAGGGTVTDYHLAYERVITGVVSPADALGSPLLLVLWVTLATAGALVQFSRDRRARAPAPPPPRSG